MLPWNRKRKAIKREDIAKMQKEKQMCRFFRKLDRDFGGGGRRLLHRASYSGNLISNTWRLENAFRVVITVTNSRFSIEILNPAI